MYWQGSGREGGAGRTGWKVEVNSARCTCKRVQRAQRCLPARVLARFASPLANEAGVSICRTKFISSSSYHRLLCFDLFCPGIKSPGYVKRPPGEPGLAGVRPACLCTTRFISPKGYCSLLRFHLFRPASKLARLRRKSSGEPDQTEGKLLTLRRTAERGSSPFRAESNIKLENRFLTFGRLP